MWHSTEAFRDGSIFFSSTRPANPESVHSITAWYFLPRSYRTAEDWWVEASTEARPLNVCIRPKNVAVIRREIFVLFSPCKLLVAPHSSIRFNRTCRCHRFRPNFRVTIQRRTAEWRARNKLVLHPDPSQLLATSFSWINAYYHL